MDGEIGVLVKASVTAAVAAVYCRYASSRIPPGLSRLATLLPAIALLQAIPWSFSTLHLRSVAFFSLSCLSFFKLLLLALGSDSAGPLHPSLPFPAFVAAACLPIKLRDTKSSNLPPIQLPSLLFSSLAKLGLLLSIVSAYDYKPLLPRFVFLLLCFLYMFLAVELLLGGSALLACGLLGLDLELPYNKPHLSTSLRDYWGRRWNLIITGVFRPIVYEPVRARWGAGAAVMATFAVSGAMHEAMVWNITGAVPTGEEAAYFLMHGACLLAENWARRRSAVRMPAAVSGAMAQGFVTATSLWLLMPPILRGGTEERAMAESLAVLEFLSSRWAAAAGILFR